MKCLSVRQPHADDIMSGRKWPENRSWKTNYRGELGIHASGTGERTGIILGTVELIDCVPFRSLRDVAYRDRTAKGPRRDAAIDLAKRISKATGIPLRKLAEHPGWGYVEGPFCWIVARPVVFDEPIPAKGRLGLWNFEREAVVCG